MKYVIGNFKKVFNKEETEQVLKDYAYSIFGEKIYFCVIPECADCETKFNLFSQNDETSGKTLLGHSDFKIAFHQTDDEVRKKVIENLKFGCEIIYCVGETEEQKEQGKAKKVLKNQLKGLKKYSSKNLIVVYEPIFALGKSQLPDINYITENIRFIKKLLKHTPVVYGGSVNENNAQQVLSKDEIDGVFFHRVSTDRKKLEKVVEIANNF